MRSFDEKGEHRKTKTSALGLERESAFWQELDGYSYYGNDHLCGGLLSAQFTKTEEKPETDGKVLGEEVYVKTSEDDSYFDQARYTRKQSRDEAISVFRSVIENENADSEARLEASENINEYAVRSEKETAAENQIKAKGFEECIVYIGEDNASVMVQTDGLTSEQAAQILDIVAAETNLNANVIKIIEVE